jgi:hypothetical protein
MTENDKEFLKEFLSAAAIGFAIVGVFILFIVLSNQRFNPTKPTKPEVVDTYENCDIIRWSTSKMAEYKYFLYCENQ